VNGLLPEQVARAHLAAGRAKEALLAIEPAAKAPNASHTVLDSYSNALRALGRGHDRLAVRRRAAGDFPDSGVAWHNLAAALGDLGSWIEAGQACQRAFAAGQDAPETWLVYSRALAGQNLLEAAGGALDEALRRRPGYIDALAQKSKLIWAITNDADRAAAVFPVHPRYLIYIADTYRIAGQADRALTLLNEGARREPNDLNLQHALAGVALEQGKLELAATAAAAALNLAPSHPVSLEAWASACLASGRINEAFAASGRLVEVQPFSQTALALHATTARLAGALDYDRLYDYEQFVRTYDIAAPSGWNSVDAFMIDLAAALASLHTISGQPPEQSLRLGTQTPGDLRAFDLPALDGFFAAVDPLIRAHLTALGSGQDPVRARNTGDYAMTGCWSIRLGAGGHHVDHIHPHGWLSSAFYVQVPPETDADDSREGWLQFGRPSYRGLVGLEPAHFKRPVPGRLVLFPSYMWHGTIPFTSSDPRMSIAFDLTPA